MNVGQLLNLENSIAAKLIRCLYFAALILILVMVVLGLLRGARLMSRPPMTPPAMAANVPAPDAAQASQDGAAWRGRHRFMARRMQDGFRPGLFAFGRNPVLGGVFVIFWTLLRGAIVLMIVRVLAELGLAVLAMPRRAES
jgi:hypothetical protein